MRTRNGNVEFMLEATLEHKQEAYMYTQDRNALLYQAKPAQMRHEYKIIGPFHDC